MIASVRNFFNDNNVIQKLNKFYESIFYPALISLIILLSYIFKTEVLGVFISLIITCFGLIISKDLKPIIPLLLGFIMIIPRREGFETGSKLYVEYLLNNLPYVIVLSCFLVLSVIFHFVVWGQFKSIFTKPTKLLLYSLPFAFLICFNGLFYKNYTINNLIFALVTVFCLIGLYAIFLNNLTYEQKTIDFFFKCCACLSVVFIAEFIYLCCTTPVIVDGKIHKNALNFGWGISNGYGNLGCYFIPAIFYLAYKSKKKYQTIMYYLLGVITYMFTRYSLSRNAILTSAIIISFILIFICFKGENKKLCFKLLIGTIIFFVFRHIINEILSYNFNIKIELLEEVQTMGTNDNGRYKLWKDAVKAFLQNPIFGQGFYGCEFESWTGFIPGMYHNTVFQLLATCGLLTFIAYLIYRYKTIKVIIYKLNDEKIFLGLIIFALVFSSLFDNIIFHIYPTFFYVIALSLCDLHYNKEKQLEKENLLK